jgi:repressor LexA
LEDEATCKRLDKRDGKVWLLPENDNYQPIDGTDARILGKVVGVVRKYN